MKDKNLSRRKFIQNTSMVAAGTVAGVLASRQSAFGKADQSDARKTLCYNENFEGDMREAHKNLFDDISCCGGHRGGGLQERGGARG